MFHTLVPYLGLALLVLFGLFLLFVAFCMLLTWRRPLAGMWLLKRSTFLLAPIALLSTALIAIFALDLLL